MELYCLWASINQSCAWTQCVQEISIIMNLNKWSRQNMSLFSCMTCLSGTWPLKCKTCLKHRAVEESESWCGLLPCETGVMKCSRAEAQCPMGLIVPSAGNLAHPGFRHSVNEPPSLDASQLQSINRFLLALVQDWEQMDWFVWDGKNVSYVVQERVRYWKLIVVWMQI